MERTPEELPRGEAPPGAGTLGRNLEVSRLLERVADLLAAQHANPHRVRAWRAAAATIRRDPEDATAILRREGRQGLERLAGIGPSLSSAIEEIARTGRLGFLDRIEGQAGPEAIFATVGGVGSTLAHRIHEELAITDLADLEAAAHDGRLARVRGFGPRRLGAIRDALAMRLEASGRARWRRAHGGVAALDSALARPTVAVVLAADERYRSLTSEGRLKRIAPRRFNPAREAWLPVLHDELDGYRVTAMFSNTARAHELGRTHDWVVVYFERDGAEAQYTVVTETRGELAGRRVVRGREPECQQHYRAEGTPGESRTRD